MTSANILVVEDEADIVNLVRYNLEKEGHTVACCYDGRSVMERVQSFNPDLIILDVMLPDRSGFEICRQIKSDEALRRVPIIMLTARSSEQDRIKGLEAGAEDYVVKPFSTRELVLRVKALLERTQTSKSLPASRVDYGLLTILPEEFRVLVSGEEVLLTQIEFKILQFLTAHPDAVKTREQILANVWDDGADDILDRAVDAHVKRLRAKLGDARDFIETVRGIGYRFIQQQNNTRNRG
ncbi:MAG: response regulator [Candidatus Melainabacteria bacterium]